MWQMRAPMEMIHCWGAFCANHPDIHLPLFLVICCVHLVHLAIRCHLFVSMLPRIRLKGETMTHSHDPAAISTILCCQIRLIPCHPVLSRLIPSHPILSHLLTSHLILSSLISFHLSVDHSVTFSSISQRDVEGRDWGGVSLKMDIFALPRPAVFPWYVLILPEPRKVTILTAYCLRITDYGLP